MSRLPIHQQPKVPSEYRFHGSYMQNETLLDLYGTLDHSGYEVCDVAMAGTNESLYDVISPTFLERLTQWCNDTLPTGAELRRASRDAARAERAIEQLEAA